MKLFQNTVSLKGVLIPLVFTLMLVFSGTAFGQKYRSNSGTSKGSGSSVSSFGTIGSTFVKSSSQNKGKSSKKKKGLHVFGKQTSVINQVSKGAKVTQSGSYLTALQAQGGAGRNLINVLKNFKEKDEVLERARELMDEMGLDTLDSLGTLHLNSVDLASGFHVLTPDQCGLGSMGDSKPPVAPEGLTISCSVLEGTLLSELPNFSLFSILGLQGGAYGSATRFTGEVVGDVSVVIADSVIFDEAEVTLSESVNELWIIANSIESYDSSITWYAADTIADARNPFPSCALGGISFSPHKSTSASAFYSPDGGDGANGQKGKDGYNGLNAPDVFLVVRSIETGANGQAELPSFDLGGQWGGEGQEGQCGGNGGHGAKGLDAESGVFDCKRGAGYGGDGGDGGAGGTGGTGGSGGEGGTVTLRYVSGESGQLNSPHFQLTGGEAGLGGNRGYSGAKGLGGKAGSSDFPLCFSEPQRAGEDGKKGPDTGHSGFHGLPGLDGTFELESITLEEFNQYYTHPYLSSVAEYQRYVGETFTFNTLNLRGSSEVRLVDIVNNEETILPLVEVALDRYELRDTGDLLSGVYRISATRNDGKVTPATLNIEVLPVISGVEFDEHYDALPGGTANLYGQGIRDDMELLHEGTVIEDFDLIDLGNNEQQIIFTIPVRPTHGDYFIRHDGNTEFEVILDQPFPLADSDVATFTLLRSAGLTFRPGTNGYSFGNGDLTEFAKAEVADDPWEAFSETYGSLEIELALAVNPLVYPFYWAWKSWWSPDNASANCLGMSTHLLNDFFNGVTGVDTYDEEDVARNVMLAQGHLLSSQFLGHFISDGFDGSDATLSSINKMISFFHFGHDGSGQGAPVLVMVPDIPGIFADAHATWGLGFTDYIGSSISYAINAIDMLAEAAGQAHALAPYMVVYEDSQDQYPSRIYFYDSNHPGNDQAFMEITRTNHGYAWSYDTFAQPQDPDPYEWSSSDNWVISTPVVGAILGDVDMLISILPF